MLLELRVKLTIGMEQHLCNIFNRYPMLEVEKALFLQWRQKELIGGAKEEECKWNTEYCATLRNQCHPLVDPNKSLSERLKQQSDDWYLTWIRKVAGRWIMHLFQHPWGSLSASGSILASKLICKKSSTCDWTYMRQSSHYFLWGCFFTHTAFSGSYQFLGQQRRHPLRWDRATNLQIWMKSVTSWWIAFLSNVDIEEAPGSS